MIDKIPFFQEKLGLFRKVQNYTSKIDTLDYRT